MDEKTRTVYSDLEQILFRGFIQQRVKLGELNLVLKSVNLKEIESIESICGFTDEFDYDAKFASLYTGYSIYVIDGENILEGDRTKFIRTWSKEIKELPEAFIQQLLVRVHELNMRSKSAFRLIEPYSYEDLSRYYWRAYKDRSLTSFEVTGVAGSEKLGFNEHQIYWMVLNRTEDSNIKYEGDWGFAKFIASSFNPKGVKSIDNSDKQRRKHEKERRERIKQQLHPDFQEQYIKVEAWSAKELQKQLVDWVEGRKDLHDEMMEQFENQQRNLWDKHQEELQEQIKKRQEEYEKICA